MDLYLFAEILAYAYLLVMIYSFIILLTIYSGNKYEITFIFRPYSAWIGVHKSLINRRIYINLIPFFTFKCEHIESMHINHMSFHELLAKKTNSHPISILISNILFIEIFITIIALIILGLFYNIQPKPNEILLSIIYYGVWSAIWTAIVKLIITMFEKK